MNTEPVLVRLLREYIAEHDRCSSEDNPDGKFCYCKLCKRARLAVAGKRGTVAVEVHDALEQIMAKMRTGARR
jgi:hypothetical protein